MPTTVPQNPPLHPFTCRACGDGYSDYDGCPKCYPAGTYDRLKERCAETYREWQDACHELQFYERQRAERFDLLVGRAHGQKETIPAGWPSGKASGS